MLLLLFFLFGQMVNRSAPVQQTVQGNNFASPALPEHTNAAMVPLTSRGSPVAPGRLWSHLQVLDLVAFHPHLCLLWVPTILRSITYTLTQLHFKDKSSEFAKITSIYLSIFAFESQFWDAFSKFPFVKNKTKQKPTPDFRAQLIPVPEGGVRKSTFFPSTL